MTDRELLTELQYVLIEPPDGGDTFPSLVWTREEVLDAVNAGVRALIRATHLRVTRVEIPVAAGAIVVPLPTDWLATAHVVWRDTATLVRTPLGPVDAFEGDLAAPGWEVFASLPLGYVDLDGPTLTLRLLPTPEVPGTLELLYIALPPLVAPDGSSTAVTVPHSPPTSVERSGAFVAPAASWTVALWVRPHSSTPSAGGYRTYYNLGMVGWIYLGSNVNVNDVMLEVSPDGLTYVDVGATPLPLGAWAYLTLTYTAATHTLVFAVNHVPVGTGIHDLSTVTFGPLDESLGAWGDHDTAQVRLWQAALTSAELRLEAQAPTAVRQADLLADTPLANPTSLGDLSGHGHAWTVPLGALASATGPFYEAALPLAPEFDSALKYAALGTLLRKVGRLIDDERARYAERRYQLTETAASILLGGFA